MSQRLIVLDEAEEELLEAEKWYEKQRAGLGREFRIAIDEGMGRLLKAPLAASPIVDISASIGARQILSNGFLTRSSSSNMGKIYGLLRLPTATGDQATGENDWNRSCPTVIGANAANHWAEKDAAERALTQSARPLLRPTFRKTWEPPFATYWSIKTMR